MKAAWCSRPRAAIEFTPSSAGRNKVATRWRRSISARDVSGSGHRCVIPA
jgi:hypothetical protein